MTATPAGDMWHYGTALWYMAIAPQAEVEGGRVKGRGRGGRGGRSVEEEKEQNAGSTKDGV